MTDESNPTPPSVHLRAVDTGDLATLFNIQCDPLANEMAAVLPRDHNAFYTHWNKIIRDPAVTARSILADETLVGTISCFEMNGQHAVGYWIAREHWNRGIATRALTLMLEEVSTRPLHARVATHNLGSICVLERCGFKIAGYQLSPPHDRFLQCEEALFKLS